MVVVGLLHPGEMGSAIGAVLRSAGATVLWASDGRSGATRQRADAAGLEDAGSAAALARRAEVILSVCPPHAARDVLRSVRGFSGVYVDANAVSPATAANSLARSGSSTAGSWGRRPSAVRLLGSISRALRRVQSRRSSPGLPSTRASSPKHPATRPP